MLLICFIPSRNTYHLIASVLIGFSLFQVTDPRTFHNFVSTGVVNQQNEVIVSYVGDFNDVAKQYETLVKLKFLHDKDAKKYIAMQEKFTAVEHATSANRVQKQKAKTP